MVENESKVVLLNPKQNNLSTSVLLIQKTGEIFMKGQYKVRPKDNISFRQKTHRRSQTSLNVYDGLQNYLLVASA